MPSYDYRCEKCEFEVDLVLKMKDRMRKFYCGKCGGKMKQFIKRFTIDPWKPITLDHIADTPLTFKKRSDLRRYCRERGWASSALL